jgi:hypothetical protein
LSRRRSVKARLRRLSSHGPREENRRIMATKSTDMCLQKAAEDEPIFVLRAQDMLAPAVVRQWANMAKDHGCSQEKVMEAYALADRMEAWPTRKFPD